MEKTNCTAFKKDGRTVCGRHDLCTKVTIVTGGKSQIERMVCGECRRRMKLPHRDITFNPVALMGKQ